MQRAVVLAGGMGTRLRPYTISIPKPLMPIGDRPILAIIISQLARCGFKRVTLAVNYQADILQAYFGDGSKWGVQLDYSLETTALSTMGPLKLIRDLPEDFLVMNGDILTDIDYGEFYRSHVLGKHFFTISAAARDQKIDYGVLEVGADGRLSGFQEKPTIPYLVSMGVYCLNRSLLEGFPKDAPYGFDHLVTDLLASAKPIFIKRHAGYWLDIGRPDDYQKAADEWPTISKAIDL